MGSAEVARSAPDGHTVLVTAAGFVIGPSVLKAPGYDPAKDFVGVAQIAIVPLLVLVPPNSRFKNFRTWSQRRAAVTSCRSRPSAMPRRRT